MNKNTLVAFITKSFFIFLCFSFKAEIQKATVTTKTKDSTNPNIIIKSTLDLKLKEPNQKEIEALIKLREKLSLKKIINNNRGHVLRKTTLFIVNYFFKKYFVKNNKSFFSGLSEKEAIYLEEFINKEQDFWIISSKFFKINNIPTGLLSIPILNSTQEWSSSSRKKNVKKTGETTLKYWQLDEKNNKKYQEFATESESKKGENNVYGIMNECVIMQKYFADKYEEFDNNWFYVIADYLINISKNKEEWQKYNLKYFLKKSDQTSFFQIQKYMLANERNLIYKFLSYYLYVKISQEPNFDIASDSVLKIFFTDQIQK